MKVRQALLETQKALAAQDIPSAGLEAQVLLRHVTGMERAHLYASLEEDLAEPFQEDLAPLLSRRLRREPLAYLLGQREFYDITLFVDRRVLVPRQETELLVDKTLELARLRPAGRTLAIADIGTGSGAIAIALAHNIPNAIIYATDISPQALEVAAVNVQKYNLQDRVLLLCGDLLTPLKGPVDIIVANLPYVPAAEVAGLQPEVLLEPTVALNGGAGGLDVIARLLLQTHYCLKPDGAIILEIDPRQAEEVTRLCRQSFPNAQTSVARDLSSAERAVIVKLNLDQRY